MIDEQFQFFLDEFGPQIERREVPPSSLARYQGRLPDQLMKYWQEFGWSGYADGLLWIVNPQEYEGVLSEWLSDSKFEGIDSFHVIAVGAFGKLHVWGEKYGSAFTLVASESLLSPQQDFSVSPKNMDFELRCFFMSEQRNYIDTYGLFDQAHIRLGGLNSGEIYGFHPALALGGPVAVENLQKVSAVEHLSFLVQLEELSVLRLPD